MHNRLENPMSFSNSYKKIQNMGIDFRDTQDIFLVKRLSVIDQRKESIRIISAWKANQRERRRYYESIKETKT